MDNKRLLQILLRDVSELEELVSGIKNAGSWEPLEMELLSTRIAGVRHMLEMVAGAERPGRKFSDPAPAVADSIHIPAQEKTSIQDTQATASAKVTEEPAVIIPAGNGGNLSPDAKTNILQDDLKELVPVQKEIKETPVPPQKPTAVHDLVIEEKVKEENTKVASPVQVVEPMPEMKAEPAVPVPEKGAEPFPTGNQDGSPTNDDMEFEEEEAVSGPKTLGEKFVHGRSVNDLLLEHGKTDSKFSNMPVSSLQTAIGINDRFLFTRELFDGNGDAFTEAIRKIDSMGSIHDAAVFLRENFKWKKNETSLKFIELVKRRFA